MTKPKYPKFPVAYTVGELIEMLKQLPADMELSGMEDGFRPVVYKQAKHVRVDDGEPDRYTLDFDNDGEEDDWEPEEDDEPELSLEEENS